MELMAVIAGLRALPQPCEVVVYSDSLYVINAIDQGWAVKWKTKEWMRNKTEVALNSDLWEELLSLCSVHSVRFRWVRGHSGNKLNEHCDKLARQIARQSDLPIDPGYVE